MISNETSIQLYQSIAEADEPRQFDHWHASSLAMCPRAQFYLRKGIAPYSKPTAALMLRWQSGHAIEAAIRQHIESVYGKEVESNQRIISKLHDLSGEYDNFDPKSKTLIEIKSIDDGAFLDRNNITGLKKKVGNLPDGRNKWGVSDEPYLHHQLQNHAYALLLKGQGVDVKHIDYVYISLRGRIVVYKTDVQDKYTDLVRNRLQTLNKAWRDDVAPDCVCQELHPLWSSVLQYCPYRKDSQPCCQVEEESNESK